MSVVLQTIRCPIPPIESLCLCLIIIIECCLMCFICCEFVWYNEILSVLLGGLLSLSQLFYIVFFPCKLSACGLFLVFLCEHSLRWIDWKCRDVILPLHLSESDTANEDTRMTHQTDHYRNYHIDVEFYHEFDVVNSSFWLCATRHSRWSACTLQIVNWCTVKSQVLNC